MTQRVSPAQLSLGVQLRPEATFDTFYPGPNDEVLRHVRALAAGTGEHAVYVWGGAGTGKTHSLHAACHAAAARGAAAAYLPLRETGLHPAVLEGFERFDLVCVDDLDAVAGEAVWEAALFHFYNRAREAGASVLFAARMGPHVLNLALPDLRSRLAWGLVLRLHPLDDADKAEALMLHARSRGLDMPEDAAHYLLRRAPRDMAALFALLDELDRHSLAARRRLTVPFVRSVLEPVAGGK